VTFTTQDIRDYLNISQTEFQRLAKRAGVRLKKSTNGYNWEPLSPKQAAKILEAHAARTRKPRPVSLSRLP